MSTETESKKRNELPIPTMEKPSIQIIMDPVIDRKLDYRVAAIAPQLDPRIEYALDPDADPLLLKVFKQEYLKVNDISPEIHLKIDGISAIELSLTYYSKQDLTMKELDEFLAAIISRLKQVFKDLKQPIHPLEIVKEQAREYLHELYAREKGVKIETAKKKVPDTSAIKCITIFGSQERANQNILAILKEMILFLKENEEIDVRKNDQFVHVLKERRGSLKSFFEIVDDWTRDKEITVNLAKILDEMFASLY